MQLDIGSEPTLRLAPVICMYDVYLWYYLLDKNITIKCDDIPAIYEVINSPYLRTNKMFESDSYDEWPVQ